MTGQTSAYPPAPPMIWIGGMQGSGKTTLADRIARRHDLPCQHIDAFTYAHLPRMSPIEPLDDQLALGTEHAVEMWHRVNAERVPLVINDVRDRSAGGVPVVVEGPQLSPAGADTYGVAGAVWLVAGAARTARVRRDRAAAAHDAAGQARADRLAQRDAAVLRGLRASLEGSGRPCIEVDDRPDWGDVHDRLVAGLGQTLVAAPRLQQGEALRSQRVYENTALVRQGLLWQEAAGIAVLPSVEFACECGRSGCAGMRRGTPEGYQRAAARGPVIAEGHVAL